MAREPLGTVDEVAEYYRVSKQTIYNWRSTGTGPEVVRRAVKVGGQLRFDWRDVERPTHGRAGGTAA